MNPNKSDNDFSVVLEKVGNQPLMTMKTLMRATGLGLSDAKKMVDKTPTTVASGLDSNKAIALMKELEALGNIVYIPGMETKTATSTTTKKAAGAKKTTAKKSTPSPLTVAAPSSDEFDAIFGATSPSSSAPKAKAKSEAKATVSKDAATANDAFDAIFGSTAPKTETKSQTKKSGAKIERTVTTDERAQSDLEKALAKALEIVGRDGFINGDRVCNLLSDLVPKMGKERRRIKIAYSANAVAVLINEADKTFAVSEAVKRMVDYSDMAESVAKETVLAIYEVLK